MISGYVGIGAVAAKLYRDLGVNKELNFLDIVEWCNEVLLKVGAYSQFKEISECLTMVDGKTQLPCGFHKLVDIMYQNQPLSWATNTMANNYQCEGCKIDKCCTQHTFYINDSCIITDIQVTGTSGSDAPDSSDKLCIIYLGMPVDDEGYPMIPDDVYFKEACAKYVTYMLDYQDWRKGQLTDKVFQKSEQDYLFYVNSARGAANMPNAAQMEALKNIWVRLIPKQNLYNKFFQGNADQEKRIRY